MSSRAVGRGGPSGISGAPAVPAVAGVVEGPPRRPLGSLSELLKTMKSVSAGGFLASFLLDLAGADLAAAGAGVGAGALLVFLPFLAILLDFQVRRRDVFWFWF